MYRWTEDGQHDIVKGTYYLPQLSREINVWLSYSGKFEGRAAVTAVPSDIATEIMISTQSATSLGCIASDSCDYMASARTS
jgi:hypothetical protein